MNGCSEIKMSYVPKVLRKSRDPRKALSFSHHPAVTPSCQLPDHKPWADPILAPGTGLAQGMTLGGQHSPSRNNPPRAHLHEAHVHLWSGPPEL